MDTPSTPASEFPLMVYQGQMISRESASARLEALKTDADFQQRAAALDPEAFRLHTELWRLSRGMSPEPVTVVNTADVTQQSNERAAAEASRRLEMYLAKGFSNEAAYQIVNQRPIPFAEKQTHERELVRLRNDTAFMARYRRAIVTQFSSTTVGWLRCRCQLEVSLT